MKTLSEVGFEPTPTFVDQNTPVRKSSTLESGALDRSAILTCEMGKIRRALSARYRVDRQASIRTLSSPEFSRILHNCVYFSLRDSVDVKNQKIAFKRYIVKNCLQTIGELAQMVERSIRIREAPGSMPGFSTEIFLSP